MTAVALPFVKLPAAFVMAKKISAWARAIYCRLVAYYNRQTGQCNPRILKLCADLGASASTIKRGLAELRRSGWIVTHRQMRGMSYELPPVASRSHGVTGDPMHGVTGEPVHGVTGEPVAAAASLLPEPDLLEPDIRPDAAAVGRGLGAEQEIPRKPAAAAVSASLSKIKPEKPASPPVAQLQFALDLQAPDPVRAQAVELVEELHAVHPQPGQPDKAIEYAEAILRASGDVGATVDLIKRNHPTWVAHWHTYRPGQFIPQLWRWFWKGEWKRAVGKPIKHENFYEREERVWKENENSEHRQWMRQYEADKLAKRLEGRNGKVAAA